MQPYLTTNDYLDRWRALSLDEMQQQPAFAAVLDYYKTKGEVVPTFGQYLEANGHVVVTFVFTDKDNAENTMFAEGADAICDAYPTLSELRRHGISKTSGLIYEPFNWTPPAATPAPGPVKIPKPVFAVGTTYDGVHYQNMGDAPYVGAVFVDARGTFVAAAHQYPFGTTYDWTLQAPTVVVPPVAPVQPVPVPAQPGTVPNFGIDVNALVQQIIAALIAAGIKRIS